MMRLWKRSGQGGELTAEEKKKRGFWWAAALVAVCALIMLGCYSGVKESAIYYSAGEAEIASDGDVVVQSWPSFDAGGETNLKSFIRYMYVGSYGMYWELRQKMNQRVLKPSEVFFPNISLEDEEFNTDFAQWKESFESLMEAYEVEYQIVDRETGASYSNSSQSLKELYEKGNSEPFFLVLVFGEDGELSLEHLENQDELSLELSQISGLTSRQVMNWVGPQSLSPALMTRPSEVEVYIYSSNENCYYSINGRPLTVSSSYAYWGVIYDEIATNYLILLAVLAACALLFPALWRLRRNSALIARIPAELAAVVVLLDLICMDLSTNLGNSYVNSDTGFEEICLMLIGFVLHAVMFGSWLLALMSLLRIADVGIVSYCKNNSILYKNTGRFFAWCKTAVCRFVESVRTVDLSDKSDSWLLKIVGVNFLILMVCCIMWVFGVFGLLVYSIVLFFILRKFLGRVKEKYGILLEAARQMAEGNLQMDIQEDLGMFEPMKEALTEVNSGFKKAVEQEVRSQNMKTELITNVSHDLKTPLTAIITYVNLLKEENLTEEERKSYVEILDRKSLRLKKLIEDLFEVSKAASGNIQIKKSQVDLAEMVRQAAMEQEDRMREAKLDCRVSVPEERVLMMLDGEKTYRILENLLINVTKYGLEGTRAWVSLTVDADRAEIVIKNISAAEINEEEPSRLTERFVRGDKARNTEGSGLGLAIVKSFTELQGGSFRIVTDGDLFKAIVSFDR